MHEIRLELAGNFEQGAADARGLAIMLTILRSLRSAFGALLLVSVPFAWLLLVAAHGGAWWTGAMYGVPPESWALVLLLAGCSHLACLAGVRLLASRGERLRGLATRCARAMAHVLGVPAVTFALALLCREEPALEMGERAVLKIAFAHQVNARFAEQATRRHSNETTGSGRDPYVCVGNGFDHTLVPWLRQKFPALRFAALSGIPRERVLPMGRDANVVDVGRVIAIGPVSFPLWNVASAPWRMSARTGRMTFIRLGDTWNVLGSATDTCS